ncbi:hypothetical protein A33Q_3736 [Indibacter alkaliphilus LW1]|uniref:Uncharacterized protein n=1 Tax=Indibacter alkaliphilus (strain CCUG 57479 / KCTC 22604 / LW1) TaxID=1189612 RepID=S2D2C5_INDAL|nr:hypothetical protein [Indibacter alkaliphilus]EOZ93477.1 hypothetical protein A33Q_3736 [Indibacter alkaliphilus LW1]
MNKQDSVEEKELELFFSEWKEKDKDIRVPEFEFGKKRKFTLWSLLPVGIAATLLFGIWFLLPSEKDYQLEYDTLIITLVEDENQEQHFVIETKSSLDEWEAPSSSLLTEF